MQLCKLLFFSLSLSFSHFCAPHALFGLINFVQCTWIIPILFLALLIVCWFVFFLFVYFSVHVWNDGMSIKQQWTHSFFFIFVSTIKSNAHCCSWTWRKSYKIPNALICSQSCCFYKPVLIYVNVQQQKMNVNYDRKRNILLKWSKQYFPRNNI